MPPSAATRLPHPVHSSATAAIARGRSALNAGHYEAAISAFRQAATLVPAQAPVHYALGMACIKAGHAADAIAPLLRARDLAPTEYDYQLGLADAYYLARQSADALPEYLRAGALRPSAVVPWSNAGALYRESGRPELALEALHRALANDPTNASALCNSALAFHDLGEFTWALDSVELALQSRADYPEALWNRALLDLLNGNFQRGWAGHEFRGVQLAKQGGLRTFPEPRWRGERFDGRRLLLWPEQGLGDQLQFVRFVPRVKALGGTVVLGCSAPLVSLFRENCPDADEVVVIGEAFAPIDLQCPLMSLPFALGLGSSLDGALVPYLHETGSTNDALDRALPATRAGPRPLRVGLVWAGQPKHVNDRNRSLSLETLRPLLGTPNVDFFSLQKGDVAEAELEPFNAACREQRRPRITPLGGLLRDFSDSAHAVSRLDLVLSVDTSTVHLAGAMGVPVWVLMPFVPDWRWQVTREDSPWYPTARLFRQPRAGSWAPVVSAVAAALADEVEAHRQLPSPRQGVMEPLP